MIWQNLFCRRQGGSAYRKKFIYSNDKTKQCKRQDGQTDGTDERKAGSDRKIEDAGSDGMG